MAEADALVYEVEDNLPQLRLDSVICIVDAYACIKYPQIGYTGKTQLGAADIMLINKIDLVTPGEIEQVEAQVRKYNDTAVLFRTQKCNMDTKFLLGMDFGKKRVAPKTHRHGTEFQSFIFTTDRCMDKGKFEQVISDLPASVYRAKGFVRSAEGEHILNFVAGRYALEDFPTDRTQLVFIGRHLA